MSGLETGPIGVELSNHRDGVNWLLTFGETAFAYAERHKKPDATMPDWSDLQPEQRDAFGRRLVGLLELERYLDAPEWGTVPLSELAVLTLQAAIGDYHATLPYTEPERRWLVETYFGHSIRLGVGEDAAERNRQLLTHAIPTIEQEGLEEDGGIDALALASGQIMDAGRPKIVTGAELIDRWWDWRRGVGEFDGIASEALAVASLRHLAALVHGRRPLS